MAYNEIKLSNTKDHSIMKYVVIIILTIIISSLILIRIFPTEATLMINGIYDEYMNLEKTASYQPILTDLIIAFVPDATKKIIHTLKHYFFIR